MGKKIKTKIHFKRDVKIKLIDESAGVTIDNLFSEVEYFIDGVKYVGKVKCSGRKFDVIPFEGFEALSEKVGKKKAKANKRLFKFIEEFTDTRQQIYDKLMKSEAFKFSDFERLISYGYVEVEAVIDGKQVLAETYIDSETEENFMVHYLVDMDLYLSWLDESGRLKIELVDFDEDMIYMVQKIFFEKEEEEEA